MTDITYTYTSDAADKATRCKEIFYASEKYKILAKFAFLHYKVHSSIKASGWGLIVGNPNITQIATSIRLGGMT